MSKSLLLVIGFAFIANVCLAQKTCHLREVDRCMAPLMVLMGDGIPTEEHELDTICETSTDVGKCMGKYAKFCMQNRQYDFGVWLIRNLFGDMFKYCDVQSPERAQLLQNAPCYSKAQKQRNTCGEEMKTNFQFSLTTPQETRISAYCCAIQSMQKCVSNHVISVCGNEVQEFSTKFMSQITGHFAENFCLDVPLESKLCKELLPPPYWKPEKPSNSTILRLVSTYMN